MSSNWPWWLLEQKGETAAWGLKEYFYTSYYWNDPWRYIQEYRFANLYLISPFSLYLWFIQLWIFSALSSTDKVSQKICADLVSEFDYTPHCNFKSVEMPLSISEPLSLQIIRITKTDAGRSRLKHLNRGWTAARSWCFGPSVQVYQSMCSKLLSKAVKFYLASVWMFWYTYITVYYRVW